MLKNNTGSSLVESLIALALFTIVVTMVFMKTMVAMSQNSPENRFKAMTIAQRSMEKAIFEKNYANTSHVFEEKWRVQQDSIKTEDASYLRIQVYFMHNTKPMLTYFYLPEHGK